MLRTRSGSAIGDRSLFRKLQGFIFIDWLALRPGDKFSIITCSTASSPVITRVPQRFFFFLGNTSSTELLSRRAIPQSLQIPSESASASCPSRLFYSITQSSDSVSDPDFAAIFEIFHGIATAKDQSNSVDKSTE